MLETQGPQRSPRATRDTREGTDIARIRRIQPEALSKPLGFSQVISATGGTHIYVSGQVAVDRAGSLVGRNDLKRQTRQTMENLKAALSAAGASFADVVKLNVFVVDFKPSDRADILEVRDEFIDRDRAPASTLIGVQCLVAPELLIEIEAYAVID